MDNCCSIIIPTYNERDNIPIILWLINEACTQADIPYEVIIVDDASPDGTQEAVKQMQRLLGSSKVSLQTRPGKLGLGTAYRHGLQYAKGDWVILMDADLSHHPKYIPTLFKVRHGAIEVSVQSTHVTQWEGHTREDVHPTCTRQLHNRQLLNNCSELFSHYNTA